MALTPPPEAHISYQFQYRKCGNCKSCRKGPGHGPYFYRYWREGGKPKSASMGKTLKVDIVRAYFFQVHRLSTEAQERWQDFKTSMVGNTADGDLSQEQLRTLALKCKEQCQKPRKADSCDTIIVLEQQTSVA